VRLKHATLGDLCVLPNDKQLRSHGNSAGLEATVLMLETSRFAEERTDTKRRKIALFGCFGVGNLGNECTLQALLYNIRNYVPDAEVSCICSGPEEVESTYHIRSSLIKEFPLSPISNRILRFLRRVFVGIPIELSRWAKAIATLRDANMLIMTGTGMLGDFGIGPLGLHYEILKWTIAAKLCRCKVLFLSVGVGPVYHPLSRRFVRAALSRADYRSYRDRFSKDYLKSIGFDSDWDHVYPDLAYSFPVGIVPTANREISRGIVVGVGLMTYFNRRGSSQADETIYRDYIVKLGNFVRWLLENKYVVRLLIGDVAYDQRARRDLRSFIEENATSCTDGSIIDEPVASVDDVLSQLASTDFVVASRFHNVLLALMLGKPVLAISYHEKVNALMAASGLSEFCQDIECIDLEKMIRQTDDLRGKMNRTKLQLQRNAQACRKALDDQYLRIFNDQLR
jgi:polysaccharide pyruvyl transferase WcaK-like protein